MANHIFVYGTLRKSPDGSLHPYLNKTANFVSYATLPGKLYQIKNYPGAVPSPLSAGYLIYGEVYRLIRPKQAFRILDRYEECTPDFPEPHEYRRVLETVTASHGRRLQAWIYWFCRPTGKFEQIPSGDYFSHLITTAN